MNLKFSKFQTVGEVVPEKDWSFLMKEGYLNMMIIGLLALVISLVSSQRIVDHHRKVAERKALSIQHREVQKKNSQERKQIGRAHV